MSNFIRLSPEELTDNPFSMIGNEWMLITAGTPEHCNTMTASWGGVGVLWNKPVAIAYVRPTRYTYGFMETADRFTLSILPERYREALRVCGTMSGRDGDKFAAAGLTVYEMNGIAAVEEARLVLVCRKLYAQDMRPDCFVDDTLLSHYKANDFHRQYVGEIEAVFKRG
ncbi:MAG: flavin reductase family protein [Clostridia bacterium]|nr:flavin reductase family protein [Clostridia bacterium]